MDNSFVPIQFCVFRKLEFGQSLNLIGNITPLGSWDITKSQQLICKNEAFWSIEINLPLQTEVEYKYYVSKTNSKEPIRWDDGVNKKFKIEPMYQDNIIQIMTFNIRFDNPNDGINKWDNRKEFVQKLIHQYDCDFIGMQEVLYNQQKYLEEKLTNYNSIWRGREASFYDGEGCPIFYKFRKWKILDQDIFWLSDMPSEPGSKTYGNQIPRICNWIKFINLIDNSIINIYNTHLDHENNQAKRLSALQIKNHMNQKFDRKERIILMGDLNCHPLEAPVQILETQQIKLQKTYKKEDYLLATYHGWYGTKLGLYIDYIFLDEKLTLKRKNIIRDSFNKVYPSDHFPILVEAQYSE